MQLDSLCEEFSVSTNTSLNFLEDITLLIIQFIKYQIKKVYESYFLHAFLSINIIMTTLESLYR